LLGFLRSETRLHYIHLDVVYRQEEYRRRKSTIVSSYMVTTVYVGPNLVTLT